MWGRPFFNFLTYLFLAIGSCGFISGQAIFEIKTEHLHYSLNKIEGKPNSFKIQEEYRLYGLDLLPDSTFIYYYISKPFFEIAGGKYNYQSKTIFTLTWDSLKTLALANDSNIYKNYYKYGKPKTYKVPFTCYTINEKGIESLTSKYDKIELIPLSSDIYNKNLVLDSFNIIEYSNNLKKDTVKIKYGLNKQLRIKKTDLWGFKVYTYGHYKIYRTEPKTMNWYSFPALQLVQIEDDLLIYTIGGNGTTFYFYFSKDPDSEIYALTPKEIKKAYKNNTSFLSQISNENEWNNRYLSINKDTKNIRIIDLFKESLNKNN